MHHDLNMQLVQGVDLACVFFFFFFNTDISVPV